MGGSRNLLGIGVIEGFFGPEWSWTSRNRFCENLKAYGGEFYIYAPKRDPFLRKNWQRRHPPEVWRELKDLSSKCRRQNLAFGLGLSPFEIHANWNQQTKQALRDKLDRLSEIEFDYLGLFFDDMKGAKDLADIQIEIVNFAKDHSKQMILFCPTYYSDDPILDKVFGQRSADYLSKIGSLPPEVQIFWTGGKVIPATISAEELRDVAQVLKRKPLIWDNYFANDGPKQCKFLKLKNLEGRGESSLKASMGWAFNLMNQPALSEILFASAVQTLTGKTRAALSTRLGQLPDAELFKKYGARFSEKGLDDFEAAERQALAKQFGQSLSSQDVRDWLEGKYLVGSECLTD